MNKAVNDGVWSGTWVAERLGVELRGDDALTGLLGLALRRNPKRAHLLVSNVLGKHVPQSPSVVHGHGVALGRRVRELLGEEEAARAVVLGYAETATGLGHSVADGLGLAPYLHSTRRPVAGLVPAGGFEESHSHATSHLLLPADPALLAGDGPLVLVDDEFSTGNTVLNTIRDLHERHPRERYVVVALVDMRSPEDMDRLTEFAGRIGTRVDLIATASGTVLLPEGVLAKGRELVARHERAAAPAAAGAARAGAAGGRVAGGVGSEWPVGEPDGVVSAGGAAGAASRGSAIGSAETVGSAAPAAAGADAGAAGEAVPEAAGRVVRVPLLPGVG
ncbi:phosphoribosyltransferase domain-containing protein, partial [Streptomyces sp. NPDC004542]|uniref:phosphoribosyltransferase domain-containing protein n=1 Tax=Streptomyces sp. NPDC004542 TaxID=3154281 RepID=UPI0033B7E47A